MNGKECQEPSIDAQLKLATKTPCWEWSEAEAKAIGCSEEDRTYYDFCCDYYNDKTDKDDTHIDLGPEFHAACKEDEDNDFYSCFWVIAGWHCSLENAVADYVDNVFADKNIEGNLIHYEFTHTYALLLTRYADKLLDISDTEKSKKSKEIKRLEDVLSEYRKFYAYGGIPNWEKRAQVWDKSHGRCWYCGKYIHPFREFEIDHVVPRSKGGTDELLNLVPTCRNCNRTKNEKSVDEFRFALYNELLDSITGRQAHLLAMSTEFSVHAHPSQSTYQYLRAYQDFKFYFERKGLQA